MTLTWTTSQPDAAADIRKLANRLRQLAVVMPDKISSGASTVLTIDNSPAGGQKASVQTTGPYPAGPLFT